MRGINMKIEYAKVGVEAVDKNEVIFLTIALVFQ